MNIFKNIYATELANIPTDLPMAKYTEDDKDWGVVVTSGSYLPRIQLYGGSSNLCKEGKINVGHYGLTTSKESTEDLGTEFDCLCLSWRFKAMDLNGEAGIISTYNPKGSEFLRIKSLCDVKDSGCLCGIEFLLWIPSVKKWATFYMASKTERRASPDLKNLVRQAATIKAKLIKRPPHTWHGSVITQCSTPFEMPEAEDMVDQATKFANPKESEIEKVESTVGGRAQ